jgi:hypothetical protein
MDDFSLVPVEHLPDFEEVSLVPVDHDPFGADGATQQAQAQAQLAQTQQAPSPIQPAHPQPLVTPTPVQNRNDCFRICSDMALPTKDYGIQFHRCVLACMSNGSSGFPSWDRYF